jgi:hypothetical protein
VALNKDSQDRLNSIKQEEQLQRSMQKILSEKLTKSKELTNSQKELSETLLGTKDLEDKLLAIQGKKDEIFKKYVGANADLGKKLIEQLETMEEYLKLEKKRKDKTQEIKDLTDGVQDSLLGSVGLSKDMLKNGIAFGVGMAIANKAVAMISSAFESTVGLSKELYTQTGATAAESARVGAETMKSMFSMEGLLYGGDALATAAKSTADYYGSTQVITGEIQRNVTKLSAMGVQGAVEMNAIFGQAAGSAGDMTDSIELIAAKSGVSTSALLNEMDGSMTRMVGKSKEQLEVFAKQSAQLVKQGGSMELMNKVADGMLDIESSMRANMKARQFGIGIETDKIREAAMAMQYGTGSAEELAAAIQEQVGSSEEFGKLGDRQKQIYADQIGMSKEELATMLVKSETMQKLRNENQGMSDEQIQAMQKENEAWEAKKTAAASYGSSILTAVIPPLLQYLAMYPAMKAMGSVGAGGDDKASPKPKRGRPAGKTKGTGGLMESFNKMDMKKVIQGAAAMVIVAAAVWVFGKAVQEFMKVSWEAVGMAVVSMLALVAAVALLGLIMSSGVGAIAIIAGAAAMVIVAAAMLVLGIAIQEIAKGFGMMGELTESLTGLITISPMLIPLVYILGSLGAAMAILGIGLLVATPGVLAFGMAVMVMAAAVPAISMMATGLGALVQIAPGLIALAGAFGLLGLSMLPLALGLALLTPFLGTVLVLGLMLPLIASAMGIGGDSSDTSSSSANGGSSDPLLEEIQGLRRDIQSQPIQIVIDDKVISTMNKKNTRMQGYRDQLK